MSFEAISIRIDKRTAYVLTIVRFFENLGFSIIDEDPEYVVLGIKKDDCERMNWLLLEHATLWRD